MDCLVTEWQGASDLMGVGGSSARPRTAVATYATERSFGMHKYNHIHNDSGRLRGSGGSSPG